MKSSSVTNVHQVCSDLILELEVTRKDCPTLQHRRQHVRRLPTGQTSHEKRKKVSKVAPCCLSSSVVQPRSRSWSRQGRHLFFPRDACLVLASSSGTDTQFLTFPPCTTISPYTLRFSDVYRNVSSRSAGVESDVRGDNTTVRVCVTFVCGMPRYPSFECFHPNLDAAGRFQCETSKPHLLHTLTYSRHACGTRYDGERVFRVTYDDPCRVLWSKTVSLHFT